MFLVMVMDSHDYLDCLLGLALMMIRPNAGKANYQPEGFQVRAKSLGGEG
jgi:hypothetical protein